MGRSESLDVMGGGGGGEVEGLLRGRRSVSGRSTRLLVWKGALKDILKG